MGGGTVRAISAMAFSEITPGPLGMAETNPNADAPQPMANAASAGELMQQILTRGRMGAGGKRHGSWFSAFHLLRQRAHQRFQLRPALAMGRDGQGEDQEKEQVFHKFNNGFPLFTRFSTPRVALSPRQPNRDSPPGWPGSDAEFFQSARSFLPTPRGLGVRQNPPPQSPTPDATPP